ncbi:MAG: hypothetical protein CM1200mP39_17680 [Dehalococcoidia bacterium]|nr:MAG: hypothetical protein CM1200mP39_17680 [Dehalococcoidia bacterium]
MASDKQRKATTRPGSRRGMTKGRSGKSDEAGAGPSTSKRSLLMFGGTIFAIIFMQL